MLALLTHPSIEVIHASVHHFYALINRAGPGCTANHALLEVHLALFDFLFEMGHNGNFGARIIHLSTQIFAKVFKFLDHRVFVGVIDQIFL